MVQWMYAQKLNVYLVLYKKNLLALRCGIIFRIYTVGVCGEIMFSFWRSYASRPDEVKF
jgi:hypothetical protein